MQDFHLWVFKGHFDELFVGSFIKHKRSLFAKEEILKNQKISLNNIISLRPLVGIRSSEVKKVLNKRAKKNIKKDSPIYFSDIY